MQQLLQTVTDHFWLAALTFLGLYTWFHLAKAQKKAAIRLEQHDS